MNMIIAILGILAISLGALMETKILDNLICEYWPSWKRFEKSISYLKGSKTLSRNNKEMFSPLEEHILKYIENKEKYNRMDKSYIMKFHLTEGQIAMVDGREEVIPGPKFNEVVKAYRDQKRSMVRIIGAILIIIGTLLLFVFQLF